MELVSLNRQNSATSSSSVGAEDHSDSGSDSSTEEEWVQQLWDWEEWRLPIEMANGSWERIYAPDYEGDESESHTPAVIGINIHLRRSDVRVDDEADDADFTGFYRLQKVTEFNIWEGNEDEPRNFSLIKWEFPDGSPDDGPAKGTSNSINDLESVFERVVNPYEPNIKIVIEPSSAKAHTITIEID